MTTIEKRLSIVPFKIVDPYQGKPLFLFMNLSLPWKSSLLLAASLLSHPLAGSPWLAISPTSIGRAGTETGFREGHTILQGNPATSAIHRQFSITGGYTYNEFNQGDYVAWADQLFQDFELNIHQRFTDLINGAPSPENLLPEIHEYLTKNASSLNGAESGTQIVKQGNLQINWNRFGLKLGNSKFMGVHSVYDRRSQFNSINGGSYLSNYKLESVGGLTPPKIPPGEDAFYYQLLNYTSPDTQDYLSATSLRNQKAYSLLEKIADQHGGLGSSPSDIFENDEDSIRLVASMLDELVKGSMGTVSPTATDPADLNNFSGLRLVHFDLKEAEWSFGFSMFEDHLHLTPSLKYMHGRVSAWNMKITDPASNSTNILDAIETELEEPAHTNEFDIDLGMLFTLGKRWTFGIQSNNLLSPSFDAPTGFADVKLDPTLRIGMAYKYSLNEDFGGSVGIDFDVIENESPIIPDFNRRMFSIGVEQGLSKYVNLHLGTGVDTAARDTTWIFSGGVGLRVSHFFLDTAITGSTDSTKIEGESVSNAGGYGISLGYNLNL